MFQPLVAAVTDAALFLWLRFLNHHGERALVHTLEIPTMKVFEPLLASARYRGAHGGRGSGKSHFFGELLVETCQAEQARFSWSASALCRARAGAILQAPDRGARSARSASATATSSSTTRSKRPATVSSSFTRRCRTTPRDCMIVAGRFQDRLGRRSADPDYCATPGALLPRPTIRAAGSELLERVVGSPGLQVRCD